MLNMASSKKEGIDLFFSPCLLGSTCEDYVLKRNYLPDGGNH